MSKKLGCGPMAAFLVIMLILIAIGSNEAIGYYFTHCDTEDDFGCLLDNLEEPEEEEGAVAATGVYTYKDYSMTVTMSIPLGGGAVSGSISGTCEGMVKGSFNGQANGAITGTLSGVCAPFFVNIPASGVFSGTVNKTAKSVPITFSGQGAGVTHDGSMTLKY